MIYGHARIMNVTTTHRIFLIHLTEQKGACDIRIILNISVKYSNISYIHFYKLHVNTTNMAKHLNTFVFHIIQVFSRRALYQILNKYGKFKDKRFKVKIIWIKSKVHDKLSRA